MLGSSEKLDFGLNAGLLRSGAYRASLEAVRPILPPTARGRQRVGQPDAPDAVGDDVHDALTTGDPPMDHQYRRSYLEAKLLEHGRP